MACPLVLFVHAYNLFQFKKISFGLDRKSGQDPKLDQAEDLQEWGVNGEPDPNIGTLGFYMVMQSSMDVMEVMSTYDIPNLKFNPQP